MTANDLRALLAVENALADVARAVRHAANVCANHRSLPGAVACGRLLARFTDELNRTHPVDVALAAMKPAAAGQRDAGEEPMIDLSM